MFERISLAGAVAIPIILDAAIKDTGILICAALFTRFATRASAATRHWVWFLSLLCLLALPLFELTLPPWPVLPGLARFIPARASSDIAPPSTNRHPHQASPIPASSKTVPSGEFADQEPPFNVDNGASSHAPNPEALLGQPAPSRPAIISTHIESHTVFRWPDVWGWSLLLWISGVFFSISPSLVGSVVFASHLRKARPVRDPSILALIEELSAELGLRRPVMALRAPGVMPVTWGLFRPRLLLPEEITAWPRARMRAVILHELAHVSRADCRNEWIGRLACAIYWFHPLAWIALGQMLADREIACDDLVLTSNADAPSYAESLLAISSAAYNLPWALGPAAPMARGRTLELRLRSILNQHVNRASPSRYRVIASASGTLLVVAVLARLAAAHGEPPAAHPTFPPTSSAPALAPSTRAATTLTDDAMVVKHPKPAVLQGFLKDQNGNPYAGAEITISPTGRTAIADAGGRFSVDLPPGVDSTVDIASAPTEKPPAPLTFHASESEVIKKTIMLRRKVAIATNEMRGRVVDSQGNPVIGAAVQLGNSGLLTYEAITGGPGGTRPSWKDGILSPAMTKTDAQGRFRFERLLAGKSDVWADADQIRWGYERNIDSTANDVTIVLHDAPKQVEFTGTVENSSGQPLQGAKTVLYFGDHFNPHQLATAVTDARGRFILHLEGILTDHFRHVTLVCTDSKGNLQWKTLPKIGADEIHLQIRDTTSVIGRLINTRGEPLAGARVWLYMGHDPDSGDMYFFRDTAAIGPWTTTDGEGRYTLDVPRGIEVTLQAKHPDYQMAMVSHVMTAGSQTKIADLEAADGATIEGIVRLPDGKRAAGATVLSTSFNEVESRTQAAENGAYHLRGLHDGSGFTIVATFGTDSQWKASRNYPGRLHAGQTLGGWDIVLDNSQAMGVAEWRARLAQWQQHPVTPPSSKYRIAVLDDCDPAIEGQATYHDTLTVYDDHGNTIWQNAQLDVRYAGAMASDPNDHSIYVYENGSRRLDKFSADGALAWRQPHVQVAAIVVDPQSGNVLLGGPKSEVLDRNRQHIADLNIWTRSMAYNPHRQTIWAGLRQGTGVRPVHLGLDGKPLNSPPVPIEPASEFTASAVNALDGSLCVTTMSKLSTPTSPPREQITVIAENGHLLRQIDLADKFSYALAVDGRREVFWVCDGGSLFKMNSQGSVLASAPVTGELCVEPDTGCVWVAGQQAVYRVSPDGAFVWANRAGPGSRKWMCLVGG